jgi:hypothetical protein
MAQATWEGIQRQQASRPLRRVHWLSRGANDDGPETDERRCPHCRHDAVQATGHVTAAGGLIRVAYRCEACRQRFSFVRRAVDFGPPPRPTASS